MPTEEGNSLQEYEKGTIQKGDELIALTKEEFHQYASSSLKWQEGMEKFAGSFGTVYFVNEEYVILDFPHGVGCKYPVAAYER